MRGWPALGVTAFLVAVLTLPVAAQQTQMRQGPGPARPGGPARDAQLDEKTGTAIIKGKVLSADTNTPLRRAQVRLMSSELRMSRMVTTDADGTFEFTQLPAGRYTLSASKAAYVGMQYGQRRPFEPGKPIELLDTQVIANADFRLPRGSAINGRVLDEFGEPVADAFVQAMQYQYVGGRRQLMPTGRGGQSNDLGQYRIYGLAPGEYYVSAAVRDPMMVSLEAGPPGPRTETTSYAPTYYPGTPGVAEAQRLSVAVGQEASSVDFALLPVRAARLSGTAVDSEGKPLANAMVMLMPRDFEGMAVRVGSGAARVEKDGSFTIRNVAPGDYVLQARSSGPFMQASPGGGVMSVMVSAPDQPAPRDPEFGYLPISVTGEDITGITLITGKGGRALGRVFFEDAATPDRSTWENMRVAARPADTDFTPMIGGMPVAVNEDGTFDLRGLVGSVVVRPMSQPKGWTLKRVEYNGQDITDSGLEFKSTEEATGVRVVLTALSTEVAGAVTDDRGRPVAEYTTIVFADDSAKWTPQSRFIKVGRPDQDGRFKVTELPPSSYLAIALDYVQQGEWGDAAFLERLKSRATSFRLGAGETKALDLKIQQY